MQFLKSMFLGLLLLLPLAAQTAKLRQIAMIDIPGRPGFDTVALANNYLVIAHGGAGTVDIFDPARRRLVAHIDGIGDARGVTVDQAGNKVYIADAANKVIDVLSMQGWKVEDQILLPNAPDGLLFIPQARMLIATSPVERTISVIRTDGAKDVQIIPAEGRPEQVVYDPESRSILVSLQDRNEIVAYPLERIGPQSRPARQIALLASEPTGLVLDANSRRLYVAVRYAVLSVELDSGSETNRVPTPAGTDTLWFDPSGRTLIAGSTDGTVTVIKVSDGRLEVDYELKTGVKGHALAYDPEKKLIYVPGGREGKSKLVILKQFGSQVQDADATKSAAITYK